MRPPAPAARDTPTSRTGTPPAAGALPGEARPERSPTRGKAAPPFGAPDAQPGVLPDAQPGTGPDAGTDAKPSAPRKEAVRRAGASPPQRLPPVGILPMDISPASARPQGPHPAGFRPAKRFRRKRRPRPELRARQTDIGRDQAQALDAGALQAGGKRRASHQRLIDRMGACAAADAAGGVALGVQVYQQHALARFGQAGCQVNCGRGFAHAALLIGDGDRLAHISPRSYPFVRLCARDHCTLSHGKSKAVPSEYEGNLRVAVLAQLI